MVFKDRTDAGCKLAEKLIEFKNLDVIVLALPRGGVQIGFEIAKKLNVPLDVLVVRKLGAPHNPEFGIGAIAPGNVRILDDTSIEYLGITEEDVEKIEKQERDELNRRVKEYRGTEKQPDLKDKIVILVDDGLATGVTARAAIKAVLQHHPQKLIIAIPVCAIDAIEGIRSILRPMNDEIICLSTPLDFSAVGHWYQSFDQVSDLEVVDLLNQAQRLKRRSQPPKSFKEQHSGLHKFS